MPIDKPSLAFPASGTRHAPLRRLLPSEYGRDELEKANEPRAEKLVREAVQTGSRSNILEAFAAALGGRLRRRCANSRKR
jgi:hypothetical protein